MINFLKRQTEHFYPGYFAMVMATGALSLSSWYLGYHAFAEFLLWLNIVVYFGLIVLNILRIPFNTTAVWSDFTNAIKGPGFFTFIASNKDSADFIVDIAVKSLQEDEINTWIINNTKKI